MANYRTFHSQLTSIMETLTRAAVAEICELVDDGYAVLHLEISRHQKENEELRQKLQLIESIIARGAGGGGPATEKPAAAREARGRDGLMREARGKAAMVDECVSRVFDENQPVTVEIKQEQPEAGETGEDGDGGDVISQDSLSEDVEEVSTEREESAVHTLFHSDSVDTHTHTHTQPEGLGRTILLESDEDNMQADYTLDSHTDSDAHTHSDAFSDTQAPTDATTHAESLVDTHTDTHAHTHTVSFLERVCVKPEVGVSELVSDWHSRAHTHTHTHAFSHTHTHGLAGRLGGPPAPLYGGGGGVGLLPHTHAHAQVHTRAHTHKRSFICAFCGKSFTTAQSLDTHTRIHTGERPFRCGQCGKRFTQSGHLTAHQTVHTGERPHPCSFCSKRFAGKQYLRIHIRKHHPDQQQG